MANNANTMKQLTDYTAIETLVYGVDEPLTETELFRNQNSDKRLNNLKFPIPTGVKYLFQYGVLHNNLVVKPQGAATPALNDVNAEQTLLGWQQDFENTSHLVITIQSVEQPTIPFALLLPYKIVRVGGLYKIVEKRVQNHQFRDAIELQEGDISVKVRYAPGFSTASAVWAKTLPSTGANPAYNAQLYLRGEITRPVAGYVE